MNFAPMSLVGAYCITLTRHRDARGSFARTYCDQAFAEAGLNTRWVQANTSHSAQVGSLRGLHFQRAPQAEIKLVRCVQGAVHDVMVDLRAGSASFGKALALELSAENDRMAYIPAGFAHGFQVLRPDSMLVYMHSAPYSSAHEGGVLATDPALDLVWPLPITQMSDRDRGLPGLAEQEPLI